MADYSKEIEEIKAQLAKKTGYMGTIEELYNKAVELREAQYEKEIEGLKSDLQEKKRQASNKSYLDKYNFDQYAEQRGLTASGESVQAQLTRNVNESNAINEAESAYSGGAVKASETKNNDILQIQQEKVNKQAAEAKEKEKSLESRLYKLEDMQKAEEKATGSSDGTNSGGTKDTYTPKISATTLANQIFERFSSDGSTLSSFESGKVYEYLNALESDTPLSADYRRDLLFVLKSKGYDAAIMDGLSTNEQARIIDSALDKGEKVFNIAYKLNERSSNKAVAKINANKEKINAILTEIYRSVYSVNQFEMLARKAGISNASIKSFYEWLDTRSTEVLGEIELKVHEE